MLDNLAKRGLSLSIIVGTLLVPLTAFAAVWLTDPDRGVEEASTPTTAALAMSVPTQPSTTASVNIAADLQTACGSEGMELVALEESESITEVQQAALDALRAVCEQQGLPLPSKPGAAPIVQTVVVPATTTGSSTSTTLRDDDDELEDDEHDEYEDDQFEDDEHEDGDQFEDDEHDEDQ